MNSRIKGITFLIFLGIYAFYFFVSTGVNTSNDGAHVGLAKAMYYDQDLSVGKYMNVYVKTPDFAIKEGVIYSDRLPGNAILILPFFAYSNALSSVGVQTSNPNHELDIVIASLMPPIFGVLSALFLFWYYFKVLKKSWLLSMGCTIIYAFGTLAMLESSHLFSHAPSLFFVSLAVLISISNIKISWQKKLVLSAILLGFASLIELQNFLFFGPILIYILYRNKQFSVKSILKSSGVIFMSGLILISFLCLLAYYNYIVFDDFTLKSNKYNPFFPEESSFLTALSGDFLNGLDRLFTSFSNIRTYYDFEVARLNDIPGVFVTSPVFLISALGFFMYKKLFKAEFWLLIACIFIAVMIAALHVTTLVRHMHSINLFLFLPFIFVVEYVLVKLKKTQRTIAVSLIGLLILISFFRVFYSTISYWGRNFDNIFEYSQEWFVFIIGNLPILLFALFVYFKKTKQLRS